ncbi:hypothetical protein QQ045_003584 [Rhodiola kirilowii]
MTKESTLIVKWLRLLGLPMKLFERGIQQRAVVSSFARFFGIDDRTKEQVALNFTRICIDLAATKRFLRRCGSTCQSERFLSRGCGGREVTLSYCTKCKLHDNDFSECKKRRDDSKLVRQ